MYSNLPRFQVELAGLDCKTVNSWVVIRLWGENKGIFQTCQTFVLYNIAFGVRYLKDLWCQASWAAISKGSIYVYIHHSYFRLYLYQFDPVSRLDVRQCSFQLKKNPFCTAKMCIYMYYIYICLKYINQMFDYIILHPFLLLFALKQLPGGHFLVVPLGVTQKTVPIEVVGYLVMRSGRQNAKVFAKQVLTSGRLGVVHASGG